MPAFATALSPSRATAVGEPLERRIRPCLLSLFPAWRRYAQIPGSAQGMPAFRGASSLACRPSAGTHPREPRPWGRGEASGGAAVWAAFAQRRIVSWCSDHASQAARAHCLTNRTCWSVSRAAKTSATVI